jgi:hypothetical protein
MAHVVQVLECSGQDPLAARHLECLTTVTLRRLDRGVVCGCPYDDD